MQVTITLRGNPGEVLKNKLNQIAKKAGDAVQNAGLVTEGSAKRRCLVDTGRLRSSIKYTKTGQTSCKVGTNVKYGPAIEYGHVTRSGSHVTAHPFIFPGYLDGKSALMSDLKSINK